MGVEYYKCDNCCGCYYEEYVSTIFVEGYGEVSLCEGCRDENMDMEPNEFVDIDQDFKYEARENLESAPVAFTSFYGLQSFVCGEPDDGIEPHYGWQFGVFDREFIYHAANKEEAEKAVAELEKKCRQIAWEKLSWKGEDNTNFYPKRKWIEREYDAVKQRIEDLGVKKQKLEEMLQ